MADDNWYQNPYEDGTTRQFRSARYAQRTSALAVLSLAAGIMSFPMMCLCFLSLPVSIFAIVCGHMSRSVVRGGQGEYSGLEMATVGLLLGYTSLIFMAGMLLFGALSHDNSPPATRPARPTVVVQKSSTPEAGQVLLQQAEALLRSADGNSMGIETTDGDAADLARHYIETLEKLDQTHFGESNEGAVTETRRYRVFVQLNKDSVAFLVDVPELERFTPEAKQILIERSWLIAQRSVDDILSSGDRVAVALYSNGTAQRIMAGVTAKEGPWDAGLRMADGTAADLASFFELDQRPAPNRSSTGAPGSKIETRQAPAEL